MYGFLTREGVSPQELLAAGRSELESYGGTAITGVVTSARRQGDTFVLSLDGGSTCSARRLLITSGIQDQLPDLPADLVLEDTRLAVEAARAAAR